MATSHSSITRSYLAMKLHLIILLLCIAFTVYAERPKQCVFPFTYKGRTFEDCTDVNADFLWCSPTKEYSGTSIPCNSEEEQQRLKRDNYYKLFKILEEQEEHIKKLEASHSTNTKCSNCKEEADAIVKSLGALSSIASDHLRKITALKDKFEKKQKFADALLTKVQQINELALRANNRRTENVWYGTAPACSGSCPQGQTLIRTDKSGDGHTCWTGHKALCQRVYFI